MNWAQIKKDLTEPIISRKADPWLIFPLAVLASWIGTSVYRSSGISYVEYILWLIPIALVLSALYILFIVWLKRKRQRKKSKK